MKREFLKWVRKEYGEIPDRPLLREEFVELNRLAELHGFGSAPPYVTVADCGHCFEDVGERA